MTDPLLKSCTCFDGTTLIASGPLKEVALTAKAALEGASAGPVLIYDDATGAVIDVDVRGSEEEVIGRLRHPIETPTRTGSNRRGVRPAPPAPPRRTKSSAQGERRPGRPKLGVVGREVTLLPRHWEWLNAQSGSASVTLRKLVEQAMRENGDKDRRRRARDAAYGFMSAIAGDMPGFEEAARALFAGNETLFRRMIADWPADVRSHAAKLAFPSEEFAEAG
ncbi:MAG: DUF2239 family protein [Pseudomonadota bacterium]